jgi:hypothetical protein
MGVEAILVLAALLAPRLSTRLPFESHAELLNNYAVDSQARADGYHQDKKQEHL